MKKEPQKHTTYEEFAGSLRGILADRRHENRESLLRRVSRERECLALGNECEWERETMVAFCMAPESPSSWLGREVFEQSWADGSMKYMAAWYDRVAREFDL